MVIVARVRHVKFGQPVSITVCSAPSVGNYFEMQIKSIFGGASAFNIPRVWPPESEDFSVGRSMNLAIRILRFFGTHPISITKLENGHLKFSLRWLSWPTFYCGVQTVIFGVISTYWWTHYVTDISANSASLTTRLNLSSVENISLQAFPAVNSFLAIIYVVTSLLSTSALVETIRNWEIFEKDFQKVFGSSEQKIFKDLWLFKRKGAGIGFVSLALLLFSTRNINHVGHIAVDQSRNFSVMGNFTIFVAFHAYAEDFRNMLLLRSVVIAFNKVLLGIKRKSGEFQDGLKLKEKMDAVHNWTDLVQKIRKQAELTGEILGWSITLIIVVVFLTFLMSLFMSVRLFVDNKFEKNRLVYDVTFASLYFCLLSYFRLWTKAWVARDIQVNEKAISNELQLMSSFPSDDDHDLLPNIEMTMLTGLIDLKPTKIVLRVVTMNYPLILALLGQVATYLVVLFQFHNMELLESSQSSIK